MISSLRARLGAALVLGAIALATVAAPASADVDVRWVDNDSKRGDGPARCDTAHFHSIQAAIDASGPNDTVFVCPGTYIEQLTIDVRGLKVQSRPTRAARIVPPETLDSVNEGTALVHITAQNVKFIGFRLEFQAGDIADGPFVLPAECQQADAGILAEGSGAQIRSNLLRTSGENTLSGACGYLFGIIYGSDFDTAGVVQPSALYGTGTAYIGDNTVRDFKSVGIAAVGDAKARIWTNKIRYVHQDDPATCLLTPVLGVNPGLTFPCDPDVDLPPDAEFLPFSVGIGVVGALADIRRNTVYSTFEPEYCYEFECPMSLGVGIGLLEPAPGSRARNNTVANTAFGFGLINDYFLDPPTALPAAPNGVQVTGNRVNESYMGFFVLGGNNVFYGNRAHLNVGGVYVLDGSDNVFDRNDFRYNFEADCDDESDGTGTLGTANDWEGLNLGDPYSSYPEGLCHGPIL